MPDPTTSAEPIDDVPPETIDQLRKRIDNAMCALVGSAWMLEQGVAGFRDVQRELLELADEENIGVRFGALSLRTRHADASWMLEVQEHWIVEALTGQRAPEPVTAAELREVWIPESDFDAEGEQSDSDTFDEVDQ